MPRFGEKSRERLLTCRTELQLVMEDAIAQIDFAVLCGHRGEEEQNRARALGFSRLWFPNSKHNSEPSMAVDIAPWPIDWSDVTRFYLLATHVLSCANKRGIKLTWGGHWRGFRDLPHYELELEP